MPFPTKLATRALEEERGESRRHTGRSDDVLTRRVPPRPSPLDDLALPSRSTIQSLLTILPRHAARPKSWVVQRSSSRAAAGNVVSRHRLSVAPMMEWSDRHYRFLVRYAFPPCIWKAWPNDWRRGVQPADERGGVEQADHAAHAALHRDDSGRRPPEEGHRGANPACAHPHHPQILRLSDPIHQTRIQRKGVVIPT